MKRALAFTGLAGLAGIAAWQGAVAWQANDEPVAKPVPPVEDVAKKAEPAQTKAKSVDAAPAATGPNSLKAETPMAERVAVVGLLNKRNGLWRDLTMKPGESIRIGDVVVRLSACEATAPWEPEQLTGAFVQVITRAANAKWYRVFSGWLYKESPSLNVVEHPIYDVWVKSCQMRHPDTGQDTIIARDSDAGSDDSPEDE